MSKAWNSIFIRRGSHAYHPDIHVRPYSHSTSYCVFEDLPGGRGSQGGAGGGAAMDIDSDGEGDAEDESNRLYYSKDAPLPMPNQLALGQARAAIYSLFREYLSKQDPALVDKALQGLASLLIGAPRLMLIADRDKLVAKVKHRNRAQKSRLFICHREMSSHTVDTR